MTFEPLGRDNAIAYAVRRSNRCQRIEDALRWAPWAAVGLLVVSVVIMGWMVSR